MAGETRERTFIYLVIQWHLLKKMFVEVEMAGVHEIGRTKIMTREMKMTLQNILSPYNMSLQDIEQPKFAPIHVLIGNDQLSLQLEDHPGLNGLARPENLKFKVSPIMMKPVAVGRVYGPQEWTKPNLVESMKKPKINKPENF